MTKQVEEKQRVVIRFAGDSGDGMQLTGDRFTNATAVLGNDLATMPDFPAEIRAPAGTVHGVSAFQIQFASTDILTPGDHPNVLVAMNPAALKAELGSVEKGGTIIVNEDAFTERNLQKAGYAPIRSPTGRSTGTRSTGPHDLDHRSCRRGARAHAQGGRALQEHVRPRARVVDVRAPTDVTLNWLHKKFGDKEQLYDANVAAFKAGYNFGETTSCSRPRTRSSRHRPSRASTATCRARRRSRGDSSRRPSGAVCSCSTRATRSPPPPSCSTSSRGLKNFNVMTLQAEDEIAAANVALGAAFAGDLGVTGTSGPGWT